MMALILVVSVLRASSTRTIDTSVINSHSELCHYSPPVSIWAAGILGNRDGPGRTGWVATAPSIAAPRVESPRPSPVSWKTRRPGYVPALQWKVRQ